MKAEELRALAERLAEADVIYGVECQHHYGITIRPCEAGVDMAAVAYNEMRETHTFLTDGNHDWSVEWSHSWNRIVVRKNEQSPYFAFNPWRLPDGPGAHWFSHKFRLASRNRLNAEVEERLSWAARWRDEALRNKQSKAGIKRYQKKLSLADSAEREARLAMARWPNHVGFRARASLLDTQTETPSHD